MTDLSKLGNLNHYLPRDFNTRICDEFVTNS